jgi:hypothetical protein
MKVYMVLMNFIDFDEIYIDFDEIYIDFDEIYIDFHQNITNIKMTMSVDPINRILWLPPPL